MFPARGRPCQGVCSSFEQEVIDRALAVKKDFYGRGATSIKVDLEDEFNGQKRIPSRSSLTRLFKSKAEVRAYEPNRPLPQGNKNKGLGIHELWQIDDMGAEQHAGVGYVGMLNVKDVFSRVQTGTHMIEYQHCREHPCAKDYVVLLRQAFTEHGMPKSIQADNGPLFRENSTKSPFPTPLHLWLVGVGIDFQHSRSYKPTDQAVIERTHQTMHKQLLRNTPYQDIKELQCIADQRRRKLNERIPCSSLDNKPPLVCYPHAAHSTKHYNTQNEAMLFDPQNIDKLLKGMEWFRLVSKDKTFSLGKKVYYHKDLMPKLQIRITFDPDNQKLNCYNVKELLASVPIRGISYQELTTFF